MDLDALKSGLLERIDAASDLAALEQIRVSALGKKGEITAQMKQLGGLDPEARKAAGQALNALKDEIAGALDARKAGFADAELDAASPPRPSTSPRPRVPCAADASTPSPKPSTKSSISLVRWASSGPKGRRSRTTGTTSQL